MSLPSVSMIVPADGPFADQAVLSVLAQEHPGLELIVLTGPDPADEDGPVARIVASRADPRLRHLRHDGDGFAAAVNQGLAVATGDLIGQIAPGDHLLPGAISRMAEEAAAFPEAEILSPWFRRTGPGGLPVTTMEPTGLAFADALRLGVWPPVSGTLTRRSFAERAGDWDESLLLSPEREWWLRDPGVTLHTVPEVLAELGGDPGDPLEHFRERLGILERFFARTGLAPEIAALREEAFSALLIEHGAALGGPTGEGDRFAVADRIAARFDTAARGRYGDELLETKTELTLARIELEAARGEIDQLAMRIEVLEDTLRRREARIDVLEGAR